MADWPPVLRGSFEFRCRLPNFVLPRTWPFPCCRSHQMIHPRQALNIYNIKRRTWKSIRCIQHRPIYCDVLYWIAGLRDSSSYYKPSGILWTVIAITSSIIRFHCDNACAWLIACWLAEYVSVFRSPLELATKRRLDVVILECCWFKQSVKLSIPIAVTTCPSAECTEIDGENSLQFLRPLVCALHILKLI